MALTKSAYFTEPSLTLGIIIFFNLANLIGMCQGLFTGLISFHFQYNPSEVFTW